jgi:hypothetical protein
MNDITTIKDFQPISTWTVDTEGGKWEGENEPKYLLDESTGRRYFNESKGCVRFKCIGLSLITPFAHLIATVVNVIYRVLKIISFANFWLPREGDSYDFKGRLKDTGLDAARIVLAPITLLSLELSSIYGWFTPYNGRKLYATIERASYGDFILAPCFQPDPQKHAFGGDVNKRDQY